MSHYTKVKTQIKSRACLVKALEDLGFEGKIEVHDIAKALVGYGGDTRQQKANVILRRNDVGGASNDIGFVLREDGTYEALISEYDTGNSASAKNALTKKIRGYGKDWTNLLQQRYALHVVEETAHNENYYIQDTTTDVDGNIYVTLETQD
jgi:hypothetical protein